MTFWIQHGYGKKDKISTVAGTGSLTGVILSPAAESSDTLASTVGSLRNHGVEPLIDPQLYLHTMSSQNRIRPAIAERRRSHFLDFGDISPSVSTSEIREQVQAVIDVNGRLGVDRIIAPSPYQSSFGDAWTRPSLDYARATIDMTEHPVLVSLVAEDVAFADWFTTTDCLDAITALDASGVYLIVGTSTGTYPFVWNPERLTKILRVIYTLTEFNNLEVLWGYSDTVGILGLLCGASGAATGWYNSLRMWKADNWAPRGGGRAAKIRMLVDSLLSVIERDSEATSIATTTSAERAVPALDVRQDLISQIRWTTPESHLNYLLTIAELHGSLNLGLPIAQRLKEFRERLVDASNLLNDLRNEGAALAPVYASQLNSFVQAIDLFVSEEDL